MKRVCCVILTAVLCLGSARAQSPEVQVELLEEEIVGVAVYPDGETPVADMPVRVWNVDQKEMTFRSRTDDNGAFRIPKVELGKNYLFIGRVRVNLKIFQPEPTAIAQSHDIVIVVSRGMVIPASPTVLAAPAATIIPASAVIPVTVVGSTDDKPKPPSPEPEPEPEPPIVIPPDPPVISP